MASVSRNPGNQSCKVLQRVKLGLLVDANGARNGKGKVGLARHLREDARAPHGLQLFLELVEPPRGLRVDVVAGRLPVAVDSQVDGECVHLGDRLAVRFRVETGCVGAVRGGELRVHEAVSDGQLRRGVTGRSQTDSTHLEKSHALAFPLEQMGDGDAGYPGSDNGDIDLDVALQGGKLINLGRRRPEGAACIRTVDAVDLPDPPHRYTSTTGPGRLAPRLNGNRGAHLRKGDLMATQQTERRNAGGGIGIGLGGILVIAGIVIALFWSVLIGVIVAVVGLVAFGGFAKGKWY